MFLAGANLNMTRPSTDLALLQIDASELHNTKLGRLAINREFRE